MKIEFFENKYGVNFDITPETVDEVAALARMANNASSEKPEVRFYFSSSPSATVWVKKVKERVQRNSIGNSKS